ncbi:MAG: ribokinase [Planctomycetaceae bacterium]|nr:ribokinase [Planctomycetaceae bacterium]
MPTPTLSPIIVVGSINTDMVIRGLRLPAPGETVLGGTFFQAAGGKGANQAVAAARAARAPVTFIGAVGDDSLGREALERFRGENLICDYLKTVVGHPSGVALILVDQQGENLISVAAGANSQLLPADLDAVPQAVFSSAKVFLTCLETPLETVAHGLRLAKRAGLVTILNPAPAPVESLPDDLLTLVDVLTPNETEAAQLVQSAGATASDQRESAVHSNTSQRRAAALQLRSRGCRSVVVTLGEHGCLVVDREITAIPGRPVAAIDATAAGDAFNGALAVALAEGQSLVDAARWAGVAAAISVTRLGAQPSLATRDEIENMLR